VVVSVTVTAVPVELGVKLFAEKLHPTLAGRFEHESTTGLAYPSNAFTFTLMVPFEPAFTEVEGVVEDTKKSVVFSCKFAEERMTPSAVPVIWKVVVASGVVPLVVLTVTVDGVPGVTVGGTALHVIPAARFAHATVTLVLIDDSGKVTA
jgi:hypothetical protein